MDAGYLNEQSQRTTLYNPAVINANDNSTSYIVDGEHWIPVPFGTTFERAIAIHREMFPAFYVPRPKPIVPKFRTFSMKSKTQKKNGKPVVYEVRKYEDGRTVCSCPGYSFRRKCKHVETVNGKIK
jgi:hypothetical protein